jgi:deoxyribonuclease-4
MKVGIAGIPTNCKGGSLEAIKCLKNLGLDSIELQFVRGVKMSEELASKIAQQNFTVSSHAPYYINLASLEKDIVEKSKDYIKKSLIITNIANGYVTAIHSGYRTIDTYERIKKNYIELLEFRSQYNIKTMLGPESRGKIKGFGSFEELMRLYNDIEIMPVFDFAHMHATNEFDFTKKDEYYRFFNLSNLDYYHIHFSEIEYGPGGEKRHLNLEEKYEPNYKFLVDVIVELGIKANIIIETPDLEISAQKLKQYYLKRRS